MQNATKLYQILSKQYEKVAQPNRLFRFDETNKCFKQQNLKFLIVQDPKQDKIIDYLYYSFQDSLIYEHQNLFMLGAIFQKNVPILKKHFEAKNLKAICIVGIKTYIQSKKPQKTQQWKRFPDMQKKSFQALKEVQKFRHPLSLVVLRLLSLSKNLSSEQVEHYFDLVVEAAMQEHPLAVLAVLQVFQIFPRPQFLDLRIKYLSFLGQRGLSEACKTILQPNVLKDQKELAKKIKSVKDKKQSRGLGFLQGAIQKKQDRNRIKNYLNNTKDRLYSIGEKAFSQFGFTIYKILNQITQYIEKCYMNSKVSKMYFLSSFFLNYDTIIKFALVFQPRSCCIIGFFSLILMIYSQNLQECQLLYQNNKLLTTAFEYFLDKCIFTNHPLVLYIYASHKSSIENAKFKKRLLVMPEQEIQDKQFQDSFLIPTRYCIIKSAMMKYPLSLHLATINLILFQAKFIIKFNFLEIASKLGVRKASESLAEQYLSGLNLPRSINTVKYYLQRIPNMSKSQQIDWANQYQTNIFGDFLKKEDNIYKIPSFPLDFSKIEDNQNHKIKSLQANKLQQAFMFHSQFSQHKIQKQRQKMQNKRMINFAYDQSKLLKKVEANEVFCSIPIKFQIVLPTTTIASKHLLVRQLGDEKNKFEFRRISIYNYQKLTQKQLNLIQKIGTYITLQFYNLKLAVDGIPLYRVQHPQWIKQIDAGIFDQQSQLMNRLLQCIELLLQNNQKKQINQIVDYIETKSIETKKYFELANLAKAFLESSQSQYQKSIEYCQKVLQLNKQNEKAKYFLSQLYLKKKQYQLAKQAADSMNESQQKRQILSRLQKIISLKIHQPSFKSTEYKKEKKKRKLLIHQKKSPEQASYLNCNKNLSRPRKFTAFNVMQYREYFIFFRKQFESSLGLQNRNNSQTKYIEYMQKMLQLPRQIDFRNLKDIKECFRFFYTINSFHNQKYVGKIIHSIQMFQLIDQISQKHAIQTLSNAKIPIQFFYQSFGQMFALLLNNFEGIVQKQAIDRQSLQDTEGAIKLYECASAYNVIFGFLASQLYFESGKIDQSEKLCDYWIETLLKNNISYFQKSKFLPKFKTLKAKILKEKEKEKKNFTKAIKLIQQTIKFIQKIDENKKKEVISFPYRRDIYSQTQMQKQMIQIMIQRLKQIKKQQRILHHYDFRQLKNQYLSQLFYIKALINFQRGQLKEALNEIQITKNNKQKTFQFEKLILQCKIYEKMENFAKATQLVTKVINKLNSQYDNYLLYFKALMTIKLNCLIKERKADQIVKVCAQILVFNQINANYVQGKLSRIILRESKEVAENYLKIISKYPELADIKNELEIEYHINNKFVDSQNQLSQADQISEQTTAIVEKYQKQYFGESFEDPKQIHMKFIKEKKEQIKIQQQKSLDEDELIDQRFQSQYDGYICNFKRYDQRFVVCFCKKLPLQKVQREQFVNAARKGFRGDLNGIKRITEIDCQLKIRSGQRLLGVIDKPEPGKKVILFKKKQNHAQTKKYLSNV